MKYYLGAYYFIKLRNANYGSIKDTKICTCSTCINDSYFDAWSISWSSSGNSGLKEAKEEFNLTNTQIKEIQTWADQKFEEKKIGWANTFSDYETLSEYKNKFFNNVQDYLIFSINFPETEKDALIEELVVKEKNIGAIGLWDNLNNQVLEVADESERQIGFDLIGVELSGDFHTFHCHDLSEELIKKFNIQINQYGLIDNDNNWEQLVEYMNEEENGFEPVPWFFVKVKLIDDMRKPMHNKS
jgi:extradiol dioxygenase family protein